MILEMAIFIASFFAGARLAAWSYDKEIDRLHHDIGLMQDQAKMHRRLIESLRQQNHDMKEVNGGSMGHDYTEDADKRATS